MGNITGIPVTYSGMLMRERKLCEQRTDEMDRRVTDDDIMSGLHKSIARTNPHKRIAQNKMTSCPRMEMTNDVLGCSRATQVHMEYMRLVNLTEICPSRRVGHFKAPC